MRDRSMIALDIGGANIKTATLPSSASDASEIRVHSHVFPVWQRAGDLAPFLASLGSHATVSVTTTAELADVFATKREGVLYILEAVRDAFPDSEINVLTVEAQLETLENAMAHPLACAAANWTISAWAAAQFFLEGILGDTGSTTTDLIPFSRGRVEASGKSDPERLVSGELVYTGCLRTPCSHIAASVPWRGHSCPVSPEYFTIMGDVYRLLDRLSDDEYDWPTPDGRGVSKPECAARLARLICADLEIMSEDEVLVLARCLHSQQVIQIAHALSQLTSRTGKRLSLLCTGTGSFLLESAAARAGLQAVRLSDYVGAAQSKVFPVWSLCMRMLAEQRGNEVFDAFQMAR